MIIYAEIADLRAGDVVEMTDTGWNGAAIRGPLLSGVGQELKFQIDCCTYVVRTVEGRLSTFANQRTLTVVNRAPRPVYVNSLRAKPEKGDVVRDADSDDPSTWLYTGDSGWPWSGFDEEGDTDAWKRDRLPARLRLLVDGVTGQVVP